MTQLDQLAQLAAAASTAIAAASDAAALADIDTRFLGRKGHLTDLLRSLKDLPIDERKIIGEKANRLREELTGQIEERRQAVSQSGEIARIDPSMPGTTPLPGAVHIINQTMADICRTFHGMGFEVAHGPHIETDFFNFEALNFPPDHPARDMQDTFFVEGGGLLRTHTTPVQPRELLKRQPPIKMIAPGRTFRNETITTRSHVSFHQVDGFFVDEGVSMADLKGTLSAFCKAYFGEDVRLKFRPSFFPFTEPSADIYVSCFLCGGSGCQLCKQAGWLEILGCGMIHPNVLRACGYDTERVSGYAFGMGVERVAMLKYRINDIRLFFQSNVRFLQQFR